MTTEDKIIEAFSILFDMSSSLIPPYNLYVLYSPDTDIKYIEKDLRDNYFLNFEDYDGIKHWEKILDKNLQPICILTVDGWEKGGSAGPGSIPSLINKRLKELALI